jgi:hypothetical protein
MTPAAAEVAHFVGWVERLVRRSSTSEGGSETHHRPGQQLIDIGRTRRLAADASAAHSDCPVDFVPEAHFGLNRDIATCLPRVPRAERFRDQVETLVQQPSS